MSKEKISVTMASETVSLVRERAQADGMTLSAWIDRAAHREAVRVGFIDHGAMVAAVGETPERLSERFQMQARRRREWKASQGIDS